MGRKVTAIATVPAALARHLREHSTVASTFDSGHAGRRLVILAALVSAVSSAPAGAAVPDPERNATAQTGWHWYHGLTAAKVKQRLAADGDRIVDVEVQSASPYRFAVATVRNEGVYKREWYWYADVTAAQVAAKLKENKARLIDLETYVARGARRFAVVMVANSGEAAKKWQWYHGLSKPLLTRRLRRNRLVDLESYRERGRTKYAAVMISNTGGDRTDWWYWLNVPLSKVQSSAVSNGARTFSLDRLPNGRYNAIQVKSKGEFSVYEVNVDASRVSHVVSQNAGRIVDIDVYKSGGERRFTVVVNDNADVFNARVRNLARASEELSEGRFGFFVRQIGGPVSVSLGADRMFESASALKVLHHLYLHTRLEGAPPENLNAIVQLPRTFCPSPQVTMGGSTTLDDADRRMMEVSDNETTFAIEQRYGRATLNQYAKSIGAAHTQINHNIGCWEKDSPTTLVDLSRMIEGASDGSLLRTEDVRNRFFDTMIQGRTIGERLEALIAEEAGLAGKSAVAQDFAANTVFRAKGGQYLRVSDGRRANAEIGRILIPYKVGGQVQQRAFAFGHFYNCETCGGDVEQTINGPFRLASAEKFRAAIRAAVATW